MSSNSPSITNLIMFLLTAILCSTCLFLTVVDATAEEAWFTSPCHEYLKQDTAHSASCLCGIGKCGNVEIYLGTRADSTALWNVIYNKESFIDSRYTCQTTHRELCDYFWVTKIREPEGKYCYCVGKTNPPCAANNGRTSHLMRTDGFIGSECNALGGLPSECKIRRGNYPEFNCVRSDGIVGQPSFWFVNMQRRYTLTQIFWTTAQRDETDHSTWEPMIRNNVQNSINQFLNVAFHVDSSVCSFWYFSDLFVKDIYLFVGKSNVSLFVNCKHPMNGQYVRVSKLTGSNIHFLVMCEIQSYVCQPGYHNFAKKQIINFDNATYRKVSPFPVCTKCPSPHLCLYGCDNVRGCLNDTLVAFNLAIHSKRIYASSGSNLAQAVKGAAGNNYARTYYCFSTLPKSGVVAHYWRVQLHNLSSVHNSTLTLPYAKSLTSYKEFMLRVARSINREREIMQTGDELCTVFRTGEFIFDDYRQKPHQTDLRPCDTCKDYTNTPADCPQGRYATIGFPPTENILSLCEVEIIGTPQIDIEIGQRCVGLSCGFYSCARPAVCNPTRRICMNYPGSYCSSDNHCLPLGQGVCERNICKLKINASCIEYTMHCATSSVCTTSEHICKSVVQGICNIDNDCVSNLRNVSDNDVVCDYFMICKLALGVPCTTTTMCVTAAKCESGICTNCKAIFSIEMEKKCKPVYYGNQCTGNNDCDNSSPRCLNGLCKCVDNHETNDFTCGSYAGAYCNNSQPCQEGMMCIQNECKILHLGNCKGYAFPHCANGSCDPIMTVCKKPVFYPCLNDYDCLTGEECENVSANMKVCKYKLGMNCTPGSNECGSSSGIAVDCSPSLKKCVLKLGEICDSDNVDHICIDGSTCAETSSGIYKCQIPYGGKCTKETSQYCIMNAGCNGQCTRNLGAICIKSWNFLTNEEECGADAICDIDFTCRCRTGKRCPYESYCTIWSFYDEVTSTCSCLPNTQSNSRFSTCVNRTQCDAGSICMVGESCSSGTERCVEDAECERKSLTCQCSMGFGVTEYARCLPTASKPCALTAAEKRQKWGMQDNWNAGKDGVWHKKKRQQIVQVPEKKERVCAPGLECDPCNNLCGIKVNYPCFPHSSDKFYCGRGRICDISGFCKLDLGANCINRTMHCMSDLVCSVFGKCKVHVNTMNIKYPRQCYSGDDCVVGAVCNSTYVNTTYSAFCVCNLTIAKIDKGDNQCYIQEKQLGGPCSNNDASSCPLEHSECRNAPPDNRTRCLCKKGYVEDEMTLTCKFSKGESCASDEQCVYGSVCDHGLCRADVGFQCSCSEKENCRTGATCTDSNVCKIKTGESCKNKEDLCDSDHVCDSLNECRRGPGGKCINHTECVAGSLCFNGFCTCSKGVSTQNSEYCFPNPGKVGSTCANEVCEGGATCIDGKCFCLVSLTNKRELTCSRTTEEVKESSKLLQYSLLLLLAGVSCCFLVGMIRRKRQKEEKAKAVFDELQDQQDPFQTIDTEALIPAQESKPAEDETKSKSTRDESQSGGGDGV